MIAITISGEASKPEYSHTYKGMVYNKFTILSRRNSGYYDAIPVVVSEFIKLPQDGDRVVVFGEVKTHNHGNKLHVYVVANEIGEYDCEDDVNHVTGDGVLVKKNPIRATPLSNKMITDFTLAVNGVTSSSYIPTISWGEAAVFMDNAEIGTNFVVNGRMQSREYEKKYADGTSEIKTAYELSVKHIKEGQNA